MRISYLSSDVCSSDLLDMDAVRKFGPRERRSPGDHIAKAAVARHLPLDRQRGGRHPAVRCHRLGRESRPDDETVARRIARCDAEAERKIAEQPALGAPHRRRRESGEGGASDKAAAVEHGGAPAGRIGGPAIAELPPISMTALPRA